MEPIEVPDPEAVRDFVGPVNIPKRFDVDNPIYAHGVVNQNQYMEFRCLSQEAMVLALDVMEEVDEDFERVFGRGYGLIETVDTADADLVLVTTGTITSTARAALARLREKGYKVGLLKIRVFRPFPTRALREILDNIPKIAVIERNISLGQEGIFCSELKAALIHSPIQHQIQGYLAGLGGSAVDIKTIEQIILDALKRDEVSDEPIWIWE
jgi:pyruvate/2-oxoacid:ferredoxin oxidoreductase alpha subunit